MNTQETHSFMTPAQAICLSQTRRIDGLLDVFLRYLEAFPSQYLQDIARAHPHLVPFLCSQPL